MQASPTALRGCSTFEVLVGSDLGYAADCAVESGGSQTLFIMWSPTDSQADQLTDANGRVGGNSKQTERHMDATNVISGPQLSRIGVQD
jgi:hypothetical protein